MDRLDQPVNKTVLLGEARQRASLVQAYLHCSKILRGLSLYEYMSIVKLKRKGNGAATWGEVRFDSGWLLSQTWTQSLRRPGKHAVVCLDGYLSMKFDKEDEIYHRRYVCPILGRTGQGRTRLTSPIQARGAASGPICPLGVLPIVGAIGKQGLSQ